MWAGLRLWALWLFGLWPNSAKIRTARRKLGEFAFFGLELECLTYFAFCSNLFLCTRQAYHCPPGLPLPAVFVVFPAAIYFCLLVRSYSHSILPTMPYYQVPSVRLLFLFPIAVSPRPCVGLALVWCAAQPRDGATPVLMTTLPGNSCGRVDPQWRCITRVKWFLIRNSLNSTKPHRALVTTKLCERMAVQPQEPPATSSIRACGTVAGHIWQMGA
jgi:hypothetical protein